MSKTVHRDGFEEEEDDYASDEGFVVPDGEISDSSSLKAERLLAARRVQEFDDEPEDVDYESPFIMRRHDKLERRRIADELPVEDSFNKDNEIVEEGTDGEGAGLHQKASEHRFSAERPAHSKPSNDGFQAKRQKHVMGADSAGFRVSDGSRNKEKRSSRAERIVSHVSREVLDLQPFSFDPDRKIAKPGNIFEEVDVGKRRKLPVDTRKKQALERIAAMNQKSQTLPDLQNAVFGGPAKRELRAGETALLGLGLPSKGPDTSHQRNSRPRSASDLDPSDLSSCSDDSDEVAGSHGSIPRAAFRTAAVERDASLVRDFRQDLSAPSMVEERRKRTAPCSWQKMEGTSGAQADAGGSAMWSSRSPDARLIMEHDGRQLSGLAAAEGRTDEVVHLYTKPRGSSLNSTIRRKQQVVLDDSSDEGERVNPKKQGPQHTSSGQQDSMVGGHAVVNHKGRRREDQDLLDHGGTGSGISMGLGPAQYAEEHEVEAVDLEALQLEIKTTEEEMKLLKNTFDSRVQSVPEEGSSVTRLRQVQGHLKVLKMRKRAEIERRRLEPFNWDKGKGAPMNEKKFKPVHEKRVRLPPQKFSPGTQQRRNVYGGDHSGLRDLNMEDFNGIGLISDHSISSESASRGAADSSDSLSTAGADDSQSREMNEEEEEEEDHPLMQSAVTHAGTVHITPSGTFLPLTKTASVHFEDGGGPSSSASLGVAMEGSIPFEDYSIYDNPRMKTCGHEAHGLNGAHGIRGVDNLWSEAGEEEACKIMEVTTTEDGRAMQQQEPDVVVGCSSPSLKEPVQLCSHLSETMQAVENTGMLRATAAVVDTNSSGAPSSHPVIEVNSESDDISSLVGRLSQKVPPDITIMTTRGELGLGGPTMSTEVNAKGGSVSNSDVVETKFEKDEQHLCGSMTLKGNAAALLTSVSLPCITLVSHAVMPSSVAGHTADLREQTGGQGSDVLPFSSIFEPEKDVDVIPDSQPESSESFIC
ncbi:hypothetical protein CEUSTIGMA_g3579.t1 [Chlamydomonas eustigma]|uniref:Uncharacterized protein n=1 Tax=Chlamydomonas eustigma TaxID=1157962 RepID=A0A250WZC6_9CHLO|nr:hypothetical protein CEUSTIGMA_g3579.t1 [Chlamydomonas eustigma]|eukprot:GAX76136.1 hypothetical protein CEUSTIGMA_g3579.t1 [Chlamydomonas eustigma]